MNYHWWWKLSTPKTTANLQEIYRFLAIAHISIFHIFIVFKTNIQLCIYYTIYCIVFRWWKMYYLKCNKRCHYFNRSVDYIIGLKWSFIKSSFIWLSYVICIISNAIIFILSYNTISRTRWQNGLLTSLSSSRILVWIPIVACMHQTDWIW